MQILLLCLNQLVIFIVLKALAFVKVGKDGWLQEQLNLSSFRDHMSTRSSAVKINPFQANDPFWYPWKHQKTFVFLMFSGVSKWITGLKRVNFNLWFSDVFRWVSKQNFILVVALQPRDGRSLSINRGHIKFF